jgi:hypothetical protein
VKHALRLRAEDGEDLRVISAVLQDALIPMSEMEFLAQDHRFVMVVSRFRWENCADLVEESDKSILTPATDGNGHEDVAFRPCQSYERVNCGICFDGVAQVRCKGIDRRDRGRIFELLAIQIEPGAIILVFSGGAALRLEGESLSCHLEDLGEPWPTRWRPRHPLAESA